MELYYRLSVYNKEGVVIYATSESNLEAFKCSLRSYEDNLLPRLKKEENMREREDTEFSERCEQEKRQDLENEQGI